MYKRPASEMDEYELKPDLSSSDAESDVFKPSSSRSKKKAKKAKNETGTDNKKSAVRVWTAEEDRIFLEIMGGLVKSKMWEAVSNDGRLAYRGNPGIRAHVIAMMNKLKKPV